MYVSVLLNESRNTRLQSLYIDLKDFVVFQYPHNYFRPNYFTNNSFDPNDSLLDLSKIDLKAQQIIRRKGSLPQFYLNREKCKCLPDPESRSYETMLLSRAAKLHHASRYNREENIATF